MRAITREWLACAADDLAAARVLLAQEDLTNMAAFHAQQAVKGSERVPDAMEGGSPWPRISIVTPSYNQGQFMDETTRSMLLHGCPNLG